MKRIERFYSRMNKLYSLSPESLDYLYNNTDKFKIINKKFFEHFIKENPFIINRVIEYKKFKSFNEEYFEEL